MLDIRRKKRPERSRDLENFEILVGEIETRHPSDGKRVAEVEHTNEEREYHASADAICDRHER